jgi:uncharacterized protein (DUF924 family)
MPGGNVPYIPTAPKSGKKGRKIFRNDPHSMSRLRALKTAQKAIDRSFDSEFWESKDGKRPLIFMHSHVLTIS